MTLNILLTHRSGVYLSADFRLSYAGRHSDNHDTQKILPVHRRDWSALIAYCGVASAPPVLKDTGLWILEQLDALPRDSTVQNLQERLARVEDVLSKIRHCPDLTISVVGFERRRPFTMVLSRGPAVGAVTNSPGLQVCVSRPKEPSLQLKGSGRPFVADEDASRIRRMLGDGGHAPNLVREALATVNASAATRLDAFNETVSRKVAGVSVECVVGYLAPTGDMAIEPHNIPGTQEYVPAFVRSDLRRGGIVGFRRALDSDGRGLHVRWKGATGSRGPEDWGSPTAMLHIFANVDGFVKTEMAEPGVTVFERRCTGEEGGTIVRLEKAQPTAATASSLLEYHSFLTDEWSRAAADVIADEVIAGRLLEDLIVVVMELEDLNAGNLTRMFDPAIKGPHAVLSELRTNAESLLSFAPAAAALLATPPPRGAIRIACIAGGTTSVGTAVYKRSSGTIRRRAPWDLHVTNAAGRTLGPDEGPQ